MSGNRPIKFRILEILLDGKEHWNYEIVPQIQEQKVDDNGIYKKGFLLHRYVITDFGRVRGSDACLRYV